jgi:hemoglobin/transferrin/lactoferrin receptor protein
LKFGSEKHSNRFTLAQQNTEVGRVTRNFGSTAERTQLDKVKMNTINFDRHDVFGSFTLNSGIEYVTNDIFSKGTNKNITDNSSTTTKARYSDSGANTKSWGIFTQGIYNFKSTGTVLQGGLRITGYDLVANFSKSNPWKLPYASIQFSNVAPSFDLGITQMVSEHLMVKGSVNQAFRNPNVDDMTKVFDSKKGVKLLVPNDRLQPEISISIDLGLAYTLSNKFMFEAGIFNSNVSNLLLDQKGSWDGKDSMIYDGVKTPVYQVTNVATANISGAYFNVKSRLYKELWMNASATTTSGTYQKGRDSFAQPLDHIPPFYGQVSLRWNGKLWFVEAQMLFNGKKEARDYSNSGEDNVDKNPPSGNPAWQIYNLRGGFSHKNGLSVQFALENLLDLRYRYFASGVTASGRSLSCTLSYKF